MLEDILATCFAHPRAILLVASTTTLVFAFYRRWKSSRQLKLPFLKFEDGDDSRQRYVEESGKLLKLGYEKVIPSSQAPSVTHKCSERMNINR